MVYLNTTKLKWARMSGTNPHSKSRNIDFSLIFLFGLTAVTGAIAVWINGDEVLFAVAIEAASVALRVFPQIVLGVVVATLFMIVVPNEVISRAMGVQSGYKGILLGSVLGSILPGGPFASLPIIYSLGRSGAGIGPLIAFFTGWAAVGVNRMIIWEVPFLGFDFSFTRFLCSLPLPIIAGMLADFLGQTFHAYSLGWEQRD